MPRLDTEKLLARLAQGKPVPAVLLLGPDVYLRDQCRNRLIEKCVPEPAREWALARFSAGDRGWEEIFQRAQTMPMLSPCQVLVLGDLAALDSLGDAARDAAVKLFEAYLADPAPFTVLVLEAPGLDDRRKLSKVLNEKAIVVDLSVGPAAAVGLAAEIAKGLGAEIERPAAALLVDILNGDLARVRLEIEKMATYLGPGRRITVAEVEALVVSAKKYTVWQLADMLAARRRDAALDFLDGLMREGEAPPAIVGALAWMYRKLIEARELPPHTPGWQAAGQLNMRPDGAEIAMRNAHKIPRAELLEGIAALADADSELKSGTPNPRAVLEFLLARLMGARTPA
jgi:DNA polymerase-3 subunit delta